MPWTTADIPDLTGWRALVTGPTSGLGTVTACELARAGAEVLLAGRDPDKVDATAGRIRAEVAGAAVLPLLLDLADLASVRRAAGEVTGPLHLLVNNAGVMATPHRRTRDGFELQLGTNHLGHFALTGLLLDRLLEAPGARVVTVSSVMATTVRTVPLTDPREPPRRYRKWQAYGGSKLANLLFTLELDRRARAQGWGLTAVAAHPGYTATNLVDAGLNLGSRRADGAIGVAATRLIGQSAAAGAGPQLMAATLPGLPGGSYVAPSGPFELRGAPRLVPLPGPAQDPALASRLWAVSEAATGVTFA